MKKQTLFSLIAVFAGSALFVYLYQYMKMFEGKDLIAAISGTFLQAVITAVITYFLLTGQSAAEEVKERNVEVFKQKNEAYKSFIDELWKAWNDKNISYSEISNLLSIVSQKIILYSNKITTEKILFSLSTLTKYVGHENLTDADKDKMQDEIINIVKILTKELDLGGDINTESIKSIKIIENTILPLLDVKEFKIKLPSLLKEKVDKSIPIGQVFYKTIEEGLEYLCVEIEKSPILIAIGPVSKQRSSFTLIGFYVEYYQNPEYWDYRDASKGWRKDFLAGWWRDPLYDKMIDFNNVDKDSISRIKNEKSDDNPINQFTMLIEKYYSEWKVNDKNILEIINICTKKINTQK
ncbi:MAG: hypothetical protein A2096_04085 [Spirochaetes bacterium GWF1_41_5]|nr:MAG: hypothetical protein A2096_04085 [Spirochaetes bacterium GWF1_41_5]